MNAIRQKIFLVSLSLVALTWLVFGQTRHHAFINFDDDVYVYENPIVAHGLTLDGVKWAFTDVHASNWHPLTWISHMLDCEIYGLNPAGHHVTNLILHAATAVLLFLLLCDMTGALWPSAFVAAVFAIHPLRVESVAWIAERKDILSALFFVLTLGAYVRYTRLPSVSRYLLVVLLFALGIMAKPMVVTLPCVLLLLDTWPLQRLATQGARRLALEKLPLLGLSLAACAVTIFAQQKAIMSAALLTRVGNALIAYVIYLRQLIFPTELAAYYPHLETNLPLWQPLLALVALIAISTAAILLRRKQPWVLFGWLWYLGMLVPVIGILQVGSQAHADRYTYLPQIGLVVAITWAVAEVGQAWQRSKFVLGGLSTVVIAALVFCAHAQAAYWKDSETLWTRTLACTSDNVVAHDNLGHAFLEQGRIDEAMVHLQAALFISPTHAKAHNNLANALSARGRANEAIAHYQTALQIEPGYAEAHNNLGIVLAQTGQMPEALAHFQAALKLKPAYAFAHNNLARALRESGRSDEAIGSFRKALELKPDYAEAHFNLGVTLLGQDRFDEAAAQFKEVLRIQPASVPARNNLAFIFSRKGDLHAAAIQYRAALEIQPTNVNALANFAWVLATCPDATIRNGSEAAELSRRANQLTGGKNPTILRTLAAALAESGQFAEAEKVAREAISLAQSDPALVEMLGAQIALYQTSAPFRDQSLASVNPSHR